MTRFEVLRPPLYDGVSVTRAAAEANVSLRTAGRWLSALPRSGARGLGDTNRGPYR
jgi:putative transposase